MLDSLWTQEPSPSPAISAEDVVKIQLDALQNNDITPQNRGIRIAYEFASPANRKAVGTLERFIQLVKNPLYRPMIGFDTAKLDQIRIVGNIAQQRVQLFRHDGESMVYVFSLSRQREGEFAGCWMIDGILRIR